LKRAALAFILAFLTTVGLVSDTVAAPKPRTVRGFRVNPSCTQILTPVMAPGGDTYDFIDGDSQKIWQELDKAIGAEMALHFKKFYDQLQANDPYLLYARTLGITADQTPGVGQILNQYEKYMQAHVAKGSIQMYFKPAFVFTLPDKTQVWVAFGQTIPDGAIFYDDVLGGEIVHRMIAQGYYPVGGIKASNDGTIGLVNMFEHDLGHLTALMQFPQLGPYLQRISKYVLAHGVKSLPFDFLYYINEGLLFVDPAQANVILAGLKLSQDDFSNAFSLSAKDIQDRLQAMTEAERLSVVQFISMEFEKDVLILGGAGRDPANRHTNHLHNMLSANRHFGSFRVPESLNWPHINEYILLILRMSHLSLEEWTAQDKPITAPLQDHRVQQIFNPKQWQHLQVPNF
jgi:hypothetical protein